MNVVVRNQSSPQGRAPGPTIISCFINNLLSIIRPEVEMLTDDWITFSTIHDSLDNEAALFRMPQDLDKIQALADRWPVTFMPHNYQTMLISNRRKSSYHPMTYNGIIIIKYPIINKLGYHGMKPVRGIW